MEEIKNKIEFKKDVNTEHKNFLEVVRYGKYITHSIYGATAYRVRAYAVNSAGTGYGTTVNLTTSSAGPANVKTFKGLAAASVKTCKGLAIASVKTKKGLN